MGLALAQSRKQSCDAAVYPLSRFRQKGFLFKIVTDDGKWVLYDNPKRRKSWVYSRELLLTSTSKTNIHAKKVLLCVEWDMNGVLYFELLKPGETVASECY